jgi:hypothetical protein
MQNHVQLVIALLIIATIPAAYAFSLGGGALVSSANGGQSDGAIVSTSDAALSQASFTGSNVNYHNWLDDATGKHVEENLNVVQGSGTYKCEFKKGSTVVNPDAVNHLVSASTSLSASQLLTVSHADKIQAGAKACNKEGDQASVDVNILIGSITGYKNSATATLTQATASQSTDSVTGSYIEFLTKSDNKELDNACSSLEVRRGSVTGYASSAATTKSQAKVSQSASSAAGSYIEFLTKSKNKELDNACSSLAIGYKDTDYYGGSVTGYASSATATLSQAKTSQSAKSAEGTPIIFKSWANNKEKDNVSPSLKVHQGTVVGYQDSATATKTQATASITGSGITIPASGGTSIQANIGANNGEGDQATVSLTTGVIATITNFKNSATATSKKATSTLSMERANAVWIDVQGHAQNKLKAIEFDHQAQQWGTTSLTAEATSSKLLITPKIT